MNVFRPCQRSEELYKRLEVSTIRSIICIFKYPLRLSTVKCLLNICTTACLLYRDGVLKTHFDS